MNKKKIKTAQVTFSDNEVLTWDVEGTFSESRTYRTAGAGSSKVLQSWSEYNITWLEYDSNEPPVAPPKTEAELEVERDAILAEKRANPMYAGTSDGRDYYYPNTARVYVDFGLGEFTGGTNGKH